MTFEDFDKEFKRTYKDEKENISKDLNKSMLDIFSSVAWMAFKRALIKYKLKLDKDE